jgi:4,5-DOPA dioxygenase extradiol
MATLPTVFVSHGSPMHALQPGAVRGVWQDIARRLPRPKAIVMSSAHWETGAPAVTAAAQPETIHDFYGFPRPLYEIQYPAKGDPALASRIEKLLKEKKIEAELDPDRGLDHGAWSPLLHMYPEADIPVIQVSVQPHLGPKHHVALGRALAPLAGEGVLLFGSGHMTHNLRYMDRSGANAVKPYAKNFQSWTNERIQSGRLDELVEYRRLSPDGAHAHPTDEHFLPLFFALGAAPAKYRAEHLYDGIEMGALAMDAYLFH